MYSEVEFSGYEEAGCSMDREEETRVMESDSTNGATEYGTRAREAREATAKSRVASNVYDTEGAAIPMDDNIPEESVIVYDKDKPTMVAEGIVRVEKTILGAYMHILSILNRRRIGEKLDGKILPAVIHVLKAVKSGNTPAPCCVNGRGHFITATYHGHFNSNQASNS
ncbi:hypothetical protein E2562_017016 [Oryza meyeriana var. granulata]|uniref:Uncharacterized protein n=1 Tax=Oryza meyeriana var. granulata TaxID=110450 RepID=A0A6G1EAH3_9ORYZ|nr:hypothetical protein E2562_017016 [Oryza meyeriana var. granulata]